MPVPFAGLELEPRQHQIRHVAGFEPSVLVRQHQLPIKENHDCKQHRGSDEFFAIRFQVVMIHGVTNEKRFDRAIGGGFRPLTDAVENAAKSVKSVSYYLADELPLRKRKVSA